MNHLSSKALSGYLHETCLSSTALFRVRTLSFNLARRIKKSSQTVQAFVSIIGEKIIEWDTKITCLEKKVNGKHMYNNISNVLSFSLLQVKRWLSQFEGFWLLLEQICSMSIPHNYYCVENDISLVDPAVLASSILTSLVKVAFNF